ncbi:MAG: hypothetical protein Q4P72_00800 [Eubacteriales bacterium]|nr:hypothetical protein [Eubacteriales bacterium]
MQAQLRTRMFKQSLITFALVLGLCFALMTTRTDASGVSFPVDITVFCYDEAGNPLPVDRATSGSALLYPSGDMGQFADVYFPGEGSNLYANNAVLFISNHPLVDHELSFPYNSLSLKSWCYSNYPSSRFAADTLNSLKIPGQNVGYNLKLNLYFSGDSSESPAASDSPSESQELNPAPTVSSDPPPTSKIDQILASTSVSFENLRSLCDELDYLLPSLPARNGYNASVKLLQVQSLRRQLADSALSSGEQDLLNRADQVITNVQNKLYIRTVATFPSTGENRAVIIVIVFAVLAAALVFVRILLRRNHH